MADDKDPSTDDRRGTDRRQGTDPAYPGPERRQGDRRATKPPAEIGRT